MNNTLSIYIHIPFCEAKCIYCNFVSSVCDENIKHKYFDYLIKEIELKSPLFKCKNIVSIYIGGGTPSCVDSKYIKKILLLIKQRFNVADNCEITIECNPNSISKEKLINYKNCGINRISFGVQSLNNKDLKILGRLHSKKSALKAIKLANEVGFENISCDLLLGLPNSNTFKSVLQVNKLINCGVKHISAYMLIVEENTPLHKKVESKQIILPSEEKTVKQYNRLVKFLKKKKFDRYEISNFSKQGYESLHNQRYWNLNSYLGFGVSAHSFYNDQRIENHSDFKSYFKEFEKQREFISQKEKLEEYIMLGLRTKFGIDLNVISNEFNIDLLKSKKEEIEFLCKNKFIDIKNNKLYIKENYFGVANQIILKLL